MTYEQQTITPERSSGVELYKIIATFLICLSHASQTFYNMAVIENKFLDCVFQFFHIYCGQAGNLIFIICSSYFLIESKGVKSRKVIKILLDSTLISVLVFIGFLIAGYRFSVRDTISQFLPDFFSNMWFVPIYVLFYMIHPMLNAAIKGVGERTLFTFCIIVFAFYGFGGMLFDWTLGMSHLARFVVAYLLVAYFKLYRRDFCENKKANVIVFAVSSVAFILLSAAKYFFEWKNFILNQFYSPVMFPLIFSGFNLLNGKKFYSKAINYTASCSLYFYCIHENKSIRGILRRNFYEYLFTISTRLYPIWILVCFAVWFIGGYLLSFLYKTVFSPLTGFISSKLSALFDRAIGFLMKKTAKKSAQVSGLPVASDEISNN